MGFSDGNAALAAFRLWKMVFAHPEQFSVRCQQGQNLLQEPRSWWEVLSSSSFTPWILRSENKSLARNTRRLSIIDVLLELVQVEGDLSLSQVMRSYQGPITCCHSSFRIKSFYSRAYDPPSPRCCAEHHKMLVWSQPERRDVSSAETNPSRKHVARLFLQVHSFQRWKRVLSLAATTRRKMRSSCSWLRSLKRGFASSSENQLV